MPRQHKGAISAFAEAKYHVLDFNVRAFYVAIVYAVLDVILYVQMEKISQGLHTIKKYVCSTKHKN